MIRKLILSAAFLLTATVASQADPIEGNWKTKKGDIAAINACGAAFCVVLKTGKYAGKSIGNMVGKDGRYRGTLTDPAEDKTYKGKGQLNGNNLSMTGIAFGIFSRTEVWIRQ